MVKQVLRNHSLSFIGEVKDWTEEFDHGSDWTLAAGLTHASRARKHFGVSKAADGWVTRRNLSSSGGQLGETRANTAYALRGKAGDLLALCY